MYLRYIGSVPTDTIRTQFKTQSWYTAIQQNLIQKSAIHNDSQFNHNTLHKSVII